MFSIEKIIHEKAPKLVKWTPKLLLSFIIRKLQKIFHEKEFNTFYKRSHYLKNLEFIDSVLEFFNITYTVKPNELKNIPSTGRVLIIANHPTGAPDSFSLVQLIGNAREDKKVKILINGMMSFITQAEGLIIPVDIAGGITKASLKAINTALQNEEAVIIFPAGLVNRMGKDGLKDIAWKSSFLKLAKRNEAPILPIRIEARNSNMFYFLSMILPKKISGLLLADEFATAQTRRPLEFNIGKVIPASSFESKKISLDEYIQKFYKHLYTVGTTQKGFLKTEITISSASNKMILKQEIKKAQTLGHTKDGKLIVLAEPVDAPFLIQELGRVREVAFRAIGGGTGEAKDNDQYDNYYKHLILWDEEDLEIVGAYRIGEVNDIIEKRGMEGLYTYKLCDFNEHFKNYTQNSIELGRSFIQPKYWGSRALDSLWQGVGAYLANNPHIVYTYGTVTINGDTPKKAISALVYFYSHHFSCTTDMMSAKTPYNMSYDEKTEFDELFKYKSYKDGFVVLKKLLKDLGTVVPTLFKQYAELYDEGAVRFFDFSINVHWNGVVEGFIIADNTMMKEAKRKRYIENFKMQAQESEG
ncbi:lysophospholipid acyltransferase family protein [Sulfurimonas sp. SAG-AH-194-L11]|nr:lysophospholipid acyltransferase family protein [Sulfurimonas sp. SAG-AH-194-L11]MDF1877049.1 lysophospholipid acyltransferase family protein [Sulfurimonas sp. SAG-AH-194-L11]